VSEYEQAISGNARKRHLLAQLLQSRSLLSLVISGVDGKFSSAFIGMDADSNFLHFDQPFSSQFSGTSADQQELGKPGTVLAVTGSIRGAPVKFDTTLTEIRQTSGTPLYICSLPDKIIYEQQRDQFRLELGAATRSEARILVAGDSYTGRMVDVSETGTCFRLRHGAPVDTGDLLSSVTLELDDQVTINPVLRVLSVYSVVRAPGMIQIGTQFDKISQEERAALRAFMKEIERNRLRNSR
jgi:c-di-GMP-binding flagellar brake protein YcgR